MRNISAKDVAQLLDSGMRDNGVDTSELDINLCNANVEVLSTPIHSFGNGHALGCEFNTDVTE